jgi:hypothetical protein
MAQYTPNYNLGKPEETDPFKDFRALFNDNMDKIDQIGGGTGIDYLTVIDGKVNIIFDDGN